MQGVAITWAKCDIKDRNLFDTVLYIQTQKAVGIEKAKFDDKHSAKKQTLYYLTRKNIY